MESLPKAWLGNIEAVRDAVDKFGLSRDELVQVVELTAEGLRRGRFRSVTNWLTLGLVADPRRFSNHLKRKGVLRSSRYNYQTSILVASIKAIVTSPGMSILPADVERYLKSSLALAKLAPSVRVVNLGLIRCIRRESKTFLKSITVTLDLLFMKEHRADRTHPTSDWQHHTLEDLATGFSYLFYLYSEHVGVTGTSFHRPDTSRVVDGKYLDILTQAVFVRSFQEWEILVDWGIHSVDHQDGNWVVSPISNRQEKAIRFGYLTSNMAVLREGLARQEGIALSDLADLLYTKILIPQDLIRIEQQPIPRAVLVLPDITPLKELLKSDELFREEGQFIAYTMQAFIAGYESLMNFEPFKGVLVRDLILISRLINMLRLAMKRFFSEHLSDDPETVIESLVPVWSDGQFEQLLAMVIDKDRVERVAQFLSSSQDDGVYDVQYRPIISADGFRMVPMNIMGSSNIVRNSIQLSRARIHADATIDPAEMLLAAAIKKLGYPSVQGVDYTFNGISGEIDVLGVMDHILFAFECKNSLLPTSGFELRTTLEHMHSAEIQLDRFALLSDKLEFLTYLSDKTGLQCNNIKSVVTCVVSVNRMLSGGLAGCHPIRGLYELCGYLFNGGIEVGGRKVRFVQGDSVTGSDLRAFIQEDLVHNLLFKAMPAVEREYLFGKSRLLSKSFALDPKLLHSILTKKGLWCDSMDENEC